MLLTLMLALGLAAAPPPDTSVTNRVGVRDIEVAPGEVLRTTTVGTGRPLVLIPGIFGAAYGYRAISGPLARSGYRTIVIEPLGYGWSSHPKDADYSFAAQTVRVSQVLDTLGVTGALVVAQSSGAAIAFRLAVVRPDLVRGLLSLDGGPAESAATPGMKKAFKFGGGLVKFALDESKLRHDVRREIVKNSGDTTWITDAVIRAYTAGQTADMGGSIDAFHQMSKSKEPDVARCPPARVHDAGAASRRHRPASVRGDRGTAGDAALEAPRFRQRQRGGFGPVYPGRTAGHRAGGGGPVGPGRSSDPGALNAQFSLAVVPGALLRRGGRAPRGAESTRA